MLDTIRAILRTRDQSSEFDIDALFVEAQNQIADGVDPEDVIADVFGLEPDYLFDAEFMSALEAGFARLN